MKSSGFMEADRDLALKRDVTNAVERLYKLQGPSPHFPRTIPRPTSSNMRDREQSETLLLIFGQKPDRILVVSQSLGFSPLAMTI